MRPTALVSGRIIRVSLELRLTDERTIRRLAAIIAADVVDYSRMTGVDEEGTVAAWQALRRELIDPAVDAHGGRIANTAGDSLLIEFKSVVEALRWAVKIQDGIEESSLPVDGATGLRLRIGVNLGDVIDAEGDLLGDGVNIAARLEALAPPGGILVSESAWMQARDRLALPARDLGQVRLKNIEREVRVIQVGPGADGPIPAAVRRAAVRTRRNRRRAAVLAALGVAALALVAIFWSQLIEPGRGDGTSAVAARPSIAVLPFANHDAADGDTYFEDGVTEDLIAELSKYRELLVIAANSSFTLRGSTLDAGAVGGELGVRYLLTGTIRRSKDRIRTSVRLVDSTTGATIWADRYDHSVNDLAGIEKSVVEKAVTALGIAPMRAEGHSPARIHVPDPRAYDLLLQANARMLRYTPEMLVEGQNLLRRAIEIDEDYARAYANLAFAHAIRVAFGWSENPSADLQTAETLIDEALQLDPNLRQAYMARAVARRSLRRFDEALAAVDRAIELDPNYADAYAQRSITLTYAGRPAEALDAVDAAIERSPKHPFFYQFDRAFALFHLERYDDAVRSLEDVLKRNPDFIPARLLMAAAYTHLKNVDEAEWAAGEVLARRPGFTILKEQAAAPYSNPDDLLRYVAGLRGAGLPE